MSSWLDIQRKLVEMTELVEIDVEGISLTRVGGYNARPYSGVLHAVEGPRTQNLKGLWRWWARTILAGAIYKKRKGVPPTLGELNKLLEPVLGHRGRSSNYPISIQENKTGIIIVNQRLKSIPRVKLLTMGTDKSLERFYNELRMRIVVWSREITPQIEFALFAVSSLVVALIFSGIGSMTNRGFGKLSINAIIPKNHALKYEIEKLDGLIKRLQQERDLQKVTEWLHEILALALSYAEKIVGKMSFDVKHFDIPPYPILSLDLNERFFMMKTTRIYSGQIEDVLRSIGQAFLKSAWKRVNRNATSKSLHTWVLGLPRHQKLPFSKQGSINHLVVGYLVKGEKDVRRQSSIAVTLIKCRSGIAVVAYGFYSKDFIALLNKKDHDALKHVSAKFKRLNVHGVVGELTKVDETFVYEDLYNIGVSFPLPQKHVHGQTQNLDTLYRACFDASWQFVIKLLSR